MDIAVVMAGTPVVRHEPVHLSAVYVGDRRRVIVPGAPIEGVLVVVRAGAAIELRIRNADRDLAVPGRKAVRAGERPEVVVERPVLLDDDDHVIDRADAAGGRRGGGPRPVRRCARRRRAGGGRERGDR
jgi:hypothetical protein